MFARPDRRRFLHWAGLFAAGPLFAAPPPKPKTDAVDFLPLPLEEEFPLPPDVRRLGSTRMRATGNINAVRFTPNSKAIVAADGDEVRGWHAADGKPMFRIKYPDGPRIDSGRLIDPMGMIVMVVSGGNIEFRTYDLPSGRLMHRSGNIKFDNANEAVFTRDGSLAAVNWRDQLTVFETKSGKQLWQQSFEEGGIVSMLFIEKNSELAIASRRELAVFEAATGKKKLTHKVDGPKKDDGEPVKVRLSTMVASADGKWIAASADDDRNNRIAIWPTGTETQVHLVDGERAVGFTPDGLTLVTTAPRLIRFWDVKTGKKLRDLAGVSGDGPQLSPDGKLLIDESFDAVIVVDLQTGQMVPFSADPPGMPHKLTFSGDKLIGELMHWGGWVEWDLKTGASRRIKPVESMDGDPVGISQDQRIAVFAKAEKAIAGPVDQAGRRIPIKVPLANGTKSIAVTRDTKTAIVLENNGLEIIDLVLGNKANIDGQMFGPEHEIILSDDSSRAIVFTRNDDENGQCEVESFDLQTRRRSCRVAAEGAVRSVAVSADGSIVAVALLKAGGRGGDHTGVVISDARTGRMISRVAPEDRHALGLAISPCNRLLARSEGNKKFSIWEVATGQLRSRFDIVGDPLSIAFTPDVRSVAMNGRGGPVLIWPVFGPPQEKAELTVGESETIWVSLAGKADEAFEAIRRLAMHSRAGSKILRERLAPIAVPDPKQMVVWIDELDHREYRKRERASKSLFDLGERARGPMEEALKTDTSAERRERLEKLLAACDKISVDQVRQMRAVEAMEHANTPESRQLLKDWAAGAPGAILTREATSALKRLQQRTS